VAVVLEALKGVHKNDAACIAELNILQATVHKILKVKLLEHSYKIRVSKCYMKNTTTQDLIPVNRLD
jgi:hypothetical protein